jgi:hypothetical protein
MTFSVSVESGPTRKASLFLKPVRTSSMKDLVGRSVLLRRVPDKNVVEIWGTEEASYVRARVPAKIAGDFSSIVLDYRSLAMASGLPGAPDVRIEGGGADGLAHLVTGAGEAENFIPLLLYALSDSLFCVEGLETPRSTSTFPSQDLSSFLLFLRTAVESSGRKPGVPKFYFLSEKGAYACDGRFVLQVTGRPFPRVSLRDRDARKAFLLLRHAPEVSFKRFHQCWELEAGDWSILFPPFEVGLSATWVSLPEGEPSNGLWHPVDRVQAKRVVSSVQEMAKSDDRMSLTLGSPLRASCFVLRDKAMHLTIPPKDGFLGALDGRTVLLQTSALAECLGAFRPSPTVEIGVTDKAVVLIRAGDRRAAIPGSFRR